MRIDGSNHGSYRFIVLTQKVFHIISIIFNSKFSNTLWFLLILIVFFVEGLSHLLRKYGLFMWMYLGIFFFRLNSSLLVKLIHFFLVMNEVIFFSGFGMSENVFFLLRFDGHRLFGLEKLAFIRRFFAFNLHLTLVHFFFLALWLLNMSFLRIGFLYNRLLVS